MNLIYLCVVLGCLISGISGYTVTGNKILDPSGAQVRIRGVDRPSFEWSATGEQASLADYTLMKGWGANVVRIATNQDFWLANSAYATTIDQQITWATSVGLGVILDLHWNNGGQQNMADRNSITYWSQVAARYKNNAWVMFELYNEPHDVSWSQWLNGDATYAGMQEMYNAVRAAGASNVVIAGGLNWAFDLSGVSSGYKLTGTNIAYATHPYDYAGKQLADWPAGFGNLAATYPVIMTEFGQYCATNTYVSDLLAYAESIGVHWTAWAWYVSGCAFPSIISDWSGTPSAGVGVLVKNYLGGKGTTSVSVTPPTTAPTTGGVAPASNSLVLYSDALASGWQDWSWSTSYSLSDTTYVHAGSKAIKFELVSYQGVYFHATSAITIGSYGQLVFYVNGGTSAKSASAASVKLYGSAGSVVGNSVNFPTAPAANQWSQVTISLSSFGLASSTAIAGIVFQSNVDTPSGGFIWMDDISFVPSSSSGSTPAPTAAPTTKPATAAPTTAPTTKPTTAPTAAPTTKPTAPATVAPTTKPTTAPVTAAPTTKPTSAPVTAAPTTKPTSAPVTAAPTTKPTTAPVTAAPTSAAGTCSAASISIVQTAGSSWQSDGQTITQYSVSIHNSCNKNLVGLTLTASNWNAINFWNLVASSTGSKVFTLPSYASVSSSAPFIAGYQNVGGQASFTISGATFQ